MESTLMETDVFQKFSQQKSTGIRWPQLPLRKKIRHKWPFLAEKKRTTQKEDGGWPVFLGVAVDVPLEVRING